MTAAAIHIAGLLPAPPDPLAEHDRLWERYTALSDERRALTRRFHTEREADVRAALVVQAGKLDGEIDTVWGLLWL